VAARSHCRYVRAPNATIQCAAGKIFPHRRRATHKLAGIERACNLASTSVVFTQAAPFRAGLDPAGWPLTLRIVPLTEFATASSHSPWIDRMTRTPRQHVGYLIVCLALVFTYLHVRRVLDTAVVGAENANEVTVNVSARGNSVIRILEATGHRSRFPTPKSVSVGRLD